MILSPEDIIEERQRIQRILRTHRRRRGELELQSAMHGSGVDPKVLMEIDDITDKIHIYEAELAALESQAAADQTPVGEVEYQAMLAEAWDSSTGRLKPAQRARLDWARVRLGITPDRAAALERVPVEIGPT